MAHQDRRWSLGVAILLGTGMVTLAVALLYFSVTLTVRSPAQFSSSPRPRAPRAPRALHHTELEPELQPRPHEGSPAQTLTATFFPPQHEYICFSDVDVDGHDYGHVQNPTMRELRRMCDATPHCAGFNTNGWLKTSTDNRTPGATNLCVKQRVRESKVLLSSATTQGSPSPPVANHVQFGIVHGIPPNALSRHQPQPLPPHHQADRDWRANPQAAGHRARDRNAGAGEDGKQAEDKDDNDDDDIVTDTDAKLRPEYNRQGSKVFPATQLPRSSSPDTEGAVGFLARGGHAVHNAASLAGFVAGLATSQQLLIFVYPLPRELVLPASNDYKYAAEARFISLLRASSFHTEEAGAATAFLVPLSCAEARFSVADRNAGQEAANKHAAAVLHHIVHAYPYWNATLGRNHVFVCGHDMGAAQRTAVAAELPSAQNMIAMVNTADLADANYAVHKDIALPPHVGDGCSTCVQGGLDLLAAHLKQLRSSSSSSSSMFKPSNNSNNSSNSNTSNGNGAGETRSMLAFVAGNMERGRVRPLIKAAVGAEQDILVVDGYLGAEQYAAALLDAKYCLLPRGHRVWSPRIMDALWAGCVPVLVADHYDLPLRRWVDYSLLALRVPEAEVANLKAILQLDERSMYEQRAAYVRRVRHLLTWPWPWPLPLPAMQQNPKDASAEDAPRLLRQRHRGQAWVLGGGDTLPLHQQGEEEEYWSEQGGRVDGGGRGASSAFELLCFELALRLSQ